MPTRKILSNQTVMTVAARGYALYFNPMPGRTEAAFLHKNGTVLPHHPSFGVDHRRGNDDVDQSLL